MRLMSYPLRGFCAIRPSTTHVTAVDSMHRQDISVRCICQVDGAGATSISGSCGSAVDPSLSVKSSMAISPPATHPFARSDPAAVAEADPPLDTRWQTEFDDDTRERWERLLAADPTSSPFVSPAWVEAWMHHCGRGATLALLS